MLKLKGERFTNFTSWFNCSKKLYLKDNLTVVTKVNILISILRLKLIDYWISKHFDYHNSF